MSRSHRRGTFILCALLLWLTRTTPAYAEARSIQEFMSYQEKWSEFALTDYVWHVEGRYEIISGTTLKFSHCPMTFLLSSDQSRNRGLSNVLEVSGRIVKEDGKLVFQVSNLLAQPKDADRLRTMRFGIDSSTAEAWYKVADWGHARAKFYSDADLEKDAIEIDRNGVLTAFRQLSPTDSAALEQLLQTARDKRVGDDLVHRILHESLQGRFTNLKRSAFNENAWQTLLAAINQQLPASQVPLKSWPAELDEKYQADPLHVYADADAEARKKLDRLFALTVSMNRIRQLANDDGSNGFVIADRIAAELPEREDLVRKYKDLAIAWNRQRVPQMTRSQLLDFCQRLEQEQQPDAAVDVKRQWLQSREQASRQDGARGLSDLADQWLSLLQDVSTATELQIEAWRINPQYSPAREWLTAHGYRLKEGRWLPEAEIAAMPLSPVDQAVREGRVEVGMNMRQVLSALGSKPDVTTRILTSQGVTEWWVYRRAGVTVRLGRAKRTADFVVESVDSAVVPNKPAEGEQPVPKDSSDRE